jgi:lipopolysaccharide transport system permease protein
MGLKDMRIAEISKIFDKYYFLTALIIANNSITRQYRDSFLGVLWTVIQPSTQVIIYAIVFSTIMRFPVENYVVSLICGVVLWGFISSSLIGASNTLIIQADTIKRCMISKTIFPIAEVLRNLYTYIVSFSIMYIFILLFTTHDIGISIVFFPLYLGAIIIILASLSIALAFLTPYIRDVGDFVNLALNISFWLTPVVYPVEMIPEDKRFLFEFNPFYILIRPIITIIYKNQIPSMYQTITLALLVIFSVVISYIIYRLCRNNFVYYL